MSKKSKVIDGGSCSSDRLYKTRMEGLMEDDIIIQRKKRNIKPHRVHVYTHTHTTIEAAIVAKIL